MVRMCDEREHRHNHEAASEVSLLWYSRVVTNDVFVHTALSYIQ
jgi:hypothetical protein